MWIIFLTFTKNLNNTFIVKLKIRNERITISVFFKKYYVAEGRSMNVPYQNKTILNIIYLVLK